MTSVNRWSMRRRWLIAISLGCLLAYLALWFEKMAITQVTSLAELDWNGDKNTSYREIAQAFYAVIVRSSAQGNRQCREFYWRSTHERIRIICQTVIHKETDQPAESAKHSE